MTYKRYTFKIDVDAPTDDPKLVLEEIKWRLDKNPVMGVLLGNPIIAKRVYME